MESYTYYGTSLDNKDHLNYQTNQHTAEITVTAAQFAGQMALRLVHDHIMSLDVSRYSNLVTKDVHQVYKYIKQNSQVRLRFVHANNSTYFSCKTCSWTVSFLPTFGSAEGSPTRLAAPCTRFLYASS